MQNEKSKRIIGSIVLYVAASVAALIAVASLVNNVLMYKNIVSQYVAQGYAAAEVTNQLLTSQLLPEICKSLGLYGGIAGLLMGLGMIYQKIAKLTELPVTVEVGSDNAYDANMEYNPVEMEDTVEEDNNSI